MAHSKVVNNSETSDFTERPVDSLCTEAIPGCLDKIDVMRERFERGVSLFHPYDKGIAENFRQLEEFDWTEQESGSM